MFSDPVKNLKLFGLREDNIVADLGAGTGFYSVAAGSIVTKGKVYAIEIVKDFLTTIKNKVRDAHLKNVDIIWGNVEDKHGTHLGDQVVDAALASNIFFQIEDKNQFIEEVKRILKVGGRLLLIDWTPGSEESIPVKFKNALPKDKVCEMFTHKGFTLEREIDAGVHHYGMILKRNEG